MKSPTSPIWQICAIMWTAEISKKYWMTKVYLILTVHPNGFSFDTSSSLKRVWRSKKSGVSRMDFVKGIAQNRSPVLVRKESFGSNHKNTKFNPNFYLSVTTEGSSSLESVKKAPLISWLPCSYKILFCIFISRVNFHMYPQLSRQNKCKVTLFAL